MYKPIIDNRHLKIDLNGNIFDTRYNKQVIHDGTIKLTIYDKTDYYKILWLKFISYFEINLPVTTRHHLFDIGFTKIQVYPTRSVTEATSIFKQPIYAKPGFRIIPNYTNYAISKNGILFDISKNKYRYSPILPVDDKHYPYYSFIYDPDKSRSHDIAIHKLLALAWKPNNDWYHNNTVNHKDGDKLNYDLSNLEWTSIDENNKHAIDNNLREDNIVCWTKNHITGEVVKHFSIKDLNKYLNTNLQLSKLRPKINKRLIHNKYEIKLNKEDNWFYDNKNLPKIIGRYKIEIFDNNKCVDTIMSAKEFAEKFELIQNTSVHNMKKEFNQKFPNKKIKITDTNSNGPYYLVNIDDKSIMKFNSMRAVANYVKCSESNVRHHMFNSPLCILNRKYVLKNEKHKNEIPLLDLNLIKSEIKPSCYYKLVKNDKIIELNSLRQISKLLRISRKKIKRLIKDKEKYKGYYIVLCDNSHLV